MINKETLGKLKSVSWIIGAILSLIALIKVVIPFFTISSPILANYEKIYIPANIWLNNNNVTIQKKDSSVYYYSKNEELTDSLIKNKLRYQNQIINNFVVNRSVLRLKLVNQTNQILNDVEVIIPNYDKIGFKNSLKYITYKIDKFQYVNSKIIINEILPNDSETIYITGNYNYLFNDVVKNDLIKIKLDKETIHFYPRQYIYIENGIDLFFTKLIIKNKWIQIFGLILIIFGMIMLIKLIIKILKKNK